MACKNIVALLHAREHYLSDATTTDSPAESRGPFVTSVDRVAQWTRGWHYDNIRRLTQDEHTPTR